ncbi:MAG: N-acetylmuramoyl-L-alanine amidase [Clostridia bacterium]|nr:N-acetylmuramoyl-L-alanine amidase [Clostridia bacterium]
MFCVLKLKKIIGLMLTTIGIFLISVAIIKNITNTSDNIEVFSLGVEPTYTIVVDAGHGLPDGGATSRNGVEEAGLNLDIALKLEESLDKLGYNVIMTRSTEQNVADSDKQTPIRNMKVSDINNRIKLVNESEADMLISIHMNNFENSKYYGWQTFYKKNSEISKVIAENIQIGISDNIERENDRVALPITSIKLIDKSAIPAVIVECGFLSNEEDLRLLLTDEYKQQIVDGIIDGIEKCYEI